MSITRTIINDLGGVRTLAGRLGHKHVTTVHHWWRSNMIPPDRWPEIENAAREAGVPHITAAWIGAKIGQELGDADKAANTPLDQAAS